MLIKIERTLKNDKAYYALCDDGSEWQFAVGTDGVDATSLDGALPEDVVPCSRQEWEEAGLPLEFDTGAEPQPVPTIPQPQERAMEHRQSADGTRAYVLQPCNAVLLDLRVTDRHGGSAVKYDRHHVEEEHTPLPNSSDRTEKVRIETTRTIAAEDEYHQAVALCGRLRNRIRLGGDQDLTLGKAATRAKSERGYTPLCGNTPFGLLSALHRTSELTEARTEVLAAVQIANQRLQHYRLSGGVLIAKIETDATAAAQSLAQMIRESMDNILAAFKAGDVEKMRQVCNDLRGFDALVDTSTAKSIQEAVKEAREAAKIVVKEARGKGRQIEEVQRMVSLAAIDRARVAAIQTVGDVVVDSVPDMAGRVVERVADVVNIDAASSPQSPQSDSALTGTD